MDEMIDLLVVHLDLLRALFVMFVKDWWRKTTIYGQCRVLTMLDSAVYMIAGSLCVCVRVQSPAFNEKFDFDVSSEDNYVNLCVWCHLPQKLDKQQRVVKPPRDILIGHVCTCMLSEIKQESWAIARMTPRCAVLWVPWKFSAVSQYADGYFSRNF